MDAFTDRLGWPTLRLSPAKHIHLYPITIYHLERFIWETAPGGIDLMSVLGDRMRPSAWDVGPAEIPRVWATGIDWSTAEAIAGWLGGRLPGRAEWLAAESAWNDRPVTDAAATTEGVDKRVCAVAAMLLRSGIPRSGLLPSWYGDFVSEFSEPPFGDRWVLRPTRGMTRLPPSGRSSAVEAAGVSVVFDVTATPAPMGANPCPGGRA